MKIKKIFAPLLSCIILTAFVSCIACEFFLHSEMPHHKTEQFSDKKSNHPDLTFLSEEDEDTDISNDFCFLKEYVPADKFDSETLFALSCRTGSFTDKTYVPAKTPLFIHLRKLRI